VRCRSDLHKYQNKAIDFVKSKKKCALFLDMGLGKTVSTLTAISDMLDEFEITRVLVLAPLVVANSVWKQETEKWEHLKHLRVEICTGTRTQREVQIQKHCDIHVINFENLIWLIENFEWKWDMLVVDESTSFKNHASKRFKKLKKVLKKLDSVVLLTGTPSPNGFTDLWGQMYILDSGERLGKTITQFRQMFCKAIRIGSLNFKWEVYSWAESQIKERIKDLCISMQASDYLTLPSKIVLYQYVNLPEKIMKLYELKRNEFILNINENKQIDSKSAGTKINKLLQVCNGSVYDEDGSEILIHDLKIQRLKEILNDNPDENFLVAYSFKSDLNRLKLAFPFAKVLNSNPKLVDDWNNKKIKMLLAYPRSSGKGLNIQFGGSVIIWFGLSWDLDSYQQFNARLYRQGQKKPIRIIHILAKDCTDDILVKAALSKKNLKQKSVIDYLKTD